MTVTFDIIKVPDNGLVKWQVTAATVDIKEEWCYARSCTATSLNVFTAIADCLNQMKEAGWIWC